MAALSLLIAMGVFGAGCSSDEVVEASSSEACLITDLVHDDVFTPVCSCSSDGDGRRSCSTCPSLFRCDQSRGACTLAWLDGARDRAHPLYLSLGAPRMALDEVSDGVFTPVTPAETTVVRCGLFRCPPQVVVDADGAGARIANLDECLQDGQWLDPGESFRPETRFGISSANTIPACIGADYGDVVKKTYVIPAASGLWVACLAFDDEQLIAVTDAQPVDPARLGLDEVAACATASKGHPCVLVADPHLSVGVCDEDRECRRPCTSSADCIGGPGYVDGEPTRAGLCRPIRATGVGGCLEVLPATRPTALAVLESSGTSVFDVRTLAGDGGAPLMTFESSSPRIQCASRRIIAVDSTARVEILELATGTSWAIDAASETDGAVIDDVALQERDLWVLHRGAAAAVVFGADGAVKRTVPVPPVAADVQRSFLSVDSDLKSSVATALLERSPSGMTIRDLSGESPAQALSYVVAAAPALLRVDALTGANASQVWRALDSDGRAGLLSLFARRARHQFDSFGHHFTPSVGAIRAFAIVSGREWEVFAFDGVDGVPPRVSALRSRTGSPAWSESLDVDTLAVDDEAVWARGVTATDPTVTLYRRDFDGAAVAVDANGIAPRIRELVTCY